MATTAPFVKLLRQLSGARDDYRTGAFDITWDGAKATLYLVFGQPNHATLQTAGGRPIEGQEVLTTLVTQLPARFQVSPWRKEVVRTETLRCTLDELIEPFAQLAGAASPAPETAEKERGGTGAAASHAGAPELGFGLDDFPLLPPGPSLWADAAASVVHLDSLVPSLPDALIVVTGPRLRAAGVVVRHRLVDAVWVEDDERSVGETAVMALMGTTEGSVSGYRLASPELAEAVTMLWRYPIAHRAIPAAWIWPESFIAELERRQRDCALVVSGPTRGVALFAAGRLVGAYADTDPAPVALPDRVVALLRSPGASVTVRQHPDEPRTEGLPEAEFHAFVPPPVAGGPPPRESTSGGPAGWSGGSTTPPTSAPPELSGMEPAAVSEPVASAADTPASRPDATPPPPPPPPPPPQQQPPPIAAAPSWFAELSTPVSPAEAGVPAAAQAEVPHAVAPEALGEVPEDATDFQAVKRDLIQIGTLWLGDGAAQAAEMITRARPSVEDIMSTIDAIAAAAVPDHEPSVIQAMAREMRFHAAEHLSGL